MYTKENLREITTGIFEALGIDATDPEAIGQMDSLQYISALTELESIFDIVFPDAMLMQNTFEDMNGFYELLIFLLGNRYEP